jgi:hypothetical protein
MMVETFLILIESMMSKGILVDKGKCRLNFRGSAELRDEVERELGLKKYLETNVKKIFLHLSQVALSRQSQHNRVQAT